MDILATNERQYNNGFHYYFVEAYHRAFPKHLEEEYAKLASLLCEYMKLCNTINLLATQADNDTINYGRKTIKVEQLEQRELELKNVLASSFQSLGSSKKCFETATILKELESVFLEKERLQSNSKGMQDIVHNENNIAKTKEELEEKIQQILSQLNVVNSLNSDGKNRLDGLQLKPEHFENFSVFGFPGIYKMALETQLCSYFEMRKTLFKKVYDYVVELLEAYQQKRYLDVHENSDLFHVINALQINLNNKQIVGGATTLSPDILNKESMLMNTITDYFKNGDLTKNGEPISEMGTLPVNYKIKEVYFNLMNTLRVRNLEESKKR